MTDARAQVPYGTLDLIVLRTLASMGPMHGFGIARRIEQVSEDLIRLNQGSIYPALLRLHKRGWIAIKWGTSENGRRAKFYSLTRLGSRELETQAETWQRETMLVAKFMEG